MNRSRLLLILILAITSIIGAGTARGDGNFFDEVFAPVNHTHYSALGTPYVHPFTFEPPQIHQDAFFIYKYTENTLEGSNEHEAEAHLDWALTERLGIVFAVPLVGNEEIDGTQNVGIGDLEIAPRVMLVERDRFILASNLFVTVPTGDETRDLGAGEATFSPLITTWHDLGNDNTFLFNFGPEIGMESGDASMKYDFSLTHSWQGPVLLEDEHEHEEGHAAHFPRGLTTLYLEMNGETELQGLERTFVELLPGISYTLTESAELRFGVLLPVSRIQRFDRQYFSSFTWIY